MRAPDIGLCVSEAVTTPARVTFCALADAGESKATATMAAMTKLDFIFTFLVDHVCLEKIQTAHHGRRVHARCPSLNTCVRG
jgi:hypothetical protein